MAKDFTVTRPSPKWVLNKDGVLVQFANNFPSFEFNPDGTYKGTLVEKKRTNLFTYPQRLYDGYWSGFQFIQGDPSTAGSPLSFDFNNWSISGTPTIDSSDTVIFNDSNADQAINKTTFWDTDKIYLISITVSNISGTDGLILGYDGSNASIFGGNLTTNGTFVYSYSPKNSNTFSIYSRTNTTATVKLNYVKEIQGFEGPFVDSSGSPIRNAYALGANQLRRSTNFISGTYTLSAYFKKKEKNIVYLACVVNASGQNTYFNLDTGEIQEGSGAFNSSIVDVGNGWYKCSTTRNRTGGVSDIGWSDALGSNIKTGDVDDGVYVCHAQLEKGTESTSPMFDTPGSTTTRNEDVITMSDASQYIPSEGAVIMEWEQREADTIYIGALSASVTAGIRKLRFEYSSTEQKLFIDDVEEDSLTGDFDFSGMDKIELGHINEVDQPNTHIRYFAIV